MDGGSSDTNEDSKPSVNVPNARCRNIVFSARGWRLYYKPFLVLVLALEKPDLTLTELVSVVGVVGISARFSKPVMRHLLNMVRSFRKFGKVERSDEVMCRIWDWIVHESIHDLAPRKRAKRWSEKHLSDILGIVDINVMRPKLKPGNGRDARCPDKCKCAELY